MSNQRLFRFFFVASVRGAIAMHGNGVAVLDDGTSASAESGEWSGSHDDDLIPVGPESDGVGRVRESSWLDYLGEGGLVTQALLYCGMANDKDECLIVPEYTKAGEGIQEEIVTRRDLIFVRHGKSTWNEFQEDPRRFVYKLKFLPYSVREGEEKRCFLDAPLCKQGMQDARNLRDSAAELHNTLKSEMSLNNKNVHFLSSALSRALCTVLIGFSSLIHKKERKVQIWSSLQEVGQGIDTHPRAAEKGSKPNIRFTRCDKEEGVEEMYENNLDVTHYDGGKIETRKNAKERMREFAAKIFDEKFEFTDEDVIVVGGHSDWFKHFFDIYLPVDECGADIQQQRLVKAARTKKIQNGGAVRLSLEKIRRSEGARGLPTFSYRIDPSSIQVLHKGFSEEHEKVKEKECECPYEDEDHK